MVKDYPLMMYIGYQIDHRHLVPYRDIFDFNLPGTYFTCIFVGRLFGYGDTGFSVANLLLLGLILAATWFWMKRLGNEVALCCALLFGITYLGFNPDVSMQREYFIILPIIISLILSSYFPKLNHYARSFIVGFLLGICPTIKPHSVISYPIIIAYLYFSVRAWESESGRKTNFSKIILLSIAGLILPSLLIVAYLIKSGGFLPFWDRGSLSTQ